MSDTVRMLPTDENSPTHPELQIIDYLFEKDGSQKKIGGLVNEFKSAIFATLLFVVLSFEFVDNLIIKIIPITNNLVIRTIIKALFFMFTFYIIQNFWLIKKKD
jgi:hypothetical protein